MALIARPFGHVVACTGCLGAALLGAWTYASSPSTPTVRADAVVVRAEPPLPPPESLAAMLISGTPNDRPSRSETVVLLDIIASIQAISSSGSSQMAWMLTEIAELPRLDTSVVTAVARGAGRLSSASARSRVLATLIERQPHAIGASRRAVLDASRTMPSSYRASVLERFVSRRGLAQTALADALGQARHLDSRSERSRVLITAARANRIEGRARSEYISIANGIASSRERRRTLEALRTRSRHIP
jgi:hypothetical protein